MYFDADHFYGRILEVEKSANKSFPDYKRGIAKVRKMMANEPNIDAVKVVRCRECQHYPEINCFGKACCNMIIDRKTVLIPRNPNDYCSYGKRKAGQND